ncbi:LLM class flavin-dependent oxidoreductase [Streptomyces johnsoniae]|uniref:LLM class flavin-dependent oxidoreductase n=1 Tax=Streptomyces johnsoniae TaxID=3075532 RepID=A0ABU2S398_9ACTN|nr:LLM class flavin-dependent oxidoreductase [Streptomyces sp. DSM 41886]MDT0443468.1 LLM class flavin-dependent oxidoreductase [Streptomyces sp. DSM 41886]
MTALHLAVALDGARLFTLRDLAELVTEAERGQLDFVTFDDSLGATPRLDALVVAAALGPMTRHIGLVPTSVVTHTEPFHFAKALATLDYASRGRAGWLPVISSDPAEAAHFGRRVITGLTPDLIAEAADYVEVVRRLWDSWEDDAVIRDAATTRFVDRDKLHYIDFEGQFFSVKGPLITPRPPQGQLPVIGTPAPWADLVLVDPAEPVPTDGKHVFGDLVVYLGDDANLRARDADAHVFAGTPQRLANQLLAWAEAGLTGFRLRPGDLDTDLTAITRALVPILRDRGVFREQYEADTLRGLLRLDRPTSRYAA